MKKGNALIIKTLPQRYTVPMLHAQCKRSLQYNLSNKRHFETRTLNSILMVSMELLLLVRLQ